ncbi:hypothetical protein [Bacillus alkalicellulosilyticus]|uniref:hypothetical protein n=1 Tax=Alkalihalobacterium alkalicellulosilyticum TaxID=1912214 RepID=UPI0009983673|nr:hypothetical protein [Bacillus alkalicellulosilyticus]
MHPTEWIELVTVGVSILVVVLISILLKGRKKKICWTIAVLILVSYSVFFVARPYMIDFTIAKKVELLEPYLEQQYPHENWTITTVPHRTSGHKHRNPYYIGVIFDSEPNVTYHYWIENSNEIYQIAYSTDKSLEDLQDYEEN